MTMNLPAFEGMNIYCIGVSEKPIFSAMQKKILASSPSASHVISMTYSTLSQLPSILEKMLQDGK